MSDTMLLNVDPDKLFEEKSVGEIKEVLRKINFEIEKKKEDLRSLVGERYRDVIVAADTITEMKTLSQEVIKDVERMNSDMSDLHTRLSLQKQDKKRDKNRITTIPLEDSVAAQIRVLLDLPELIWEAIDSKNYILASQFYLFGRHIVTGFSVDQNLKTIGNSMPILHQQWSQIKQFSDTILNCAYNDLRELTLDPQECCTCLGGIGLLEPTSLTSKFLSLRAQGVKQILTSSKDVKSRIVESHSAIVHTLSVLHLCFIDNKGTSQGLVYQKLQSIVDSKAKPVANLISYNIHMTYLPPVILQYRVNLACKLEDLEIETTSKLLSEWLCSIYQTIENQGKTLLTNITSLRALNSLSNINVREGSDLENLLKLLKISDSFDLWNAHYKPLIISRAKELISLHWNEAYSSLVSSVNELLEETTSKPELEFYAYIWKESSNDIPPTLSSDSSRGLLLKAKGIPPKVASTCSKLQMTLEELFGDMNSLFTTQGKSPEMGGLRKHQQSSCLGLLLKFKTFMRDLANKEKDDEQKLSVMARFLQAIPDLCPALQKCLTVADDIKDNSWHEAKMLLHAESLYCWGFWEDAVLLQLKNSIPDSSFKSDSLASLLTNIPKWDVAWIEEEDGEDGNIKKKSELNVPSAPSLPLQRTLFLLSKKISLSHVPRLVAENLVHRLIPHILSQYGSTPICQAESFQNLFDLKYLFLQFIPSTKKDIYTLCQEKIASVEKEIDPFDLDVFGPYIRDNVKSSIQRTQGLYSVRLIPSDSLSGSKLSDDPCILALSKKSSTVWFPPLPVTNPLNRPLHMVKSKAAKGSKLIPTEDTSLNKSSSSSSFFTDWFS